MKRLIAAVLSIAACGGGGREPFPTLEPDPAFPGTPSDEAQFDSLFRYQPAPECAATSPTKLNAKTELRIFRTKGISDADVTAFLGGLRRYFDQYGVHVFARHQVITVPLDHALTFDLDDITDYLTEHSSFDTSKTQLTPAEQAEVERLVGQAIFHNVREMIRVYGQPRRNQVNLWLVPEIATGDAEDPDLQMLTAQLAGLGLSSELLDSAPQDDPARKLYDWVGATDFTPIAMVGTTLVKAALKYPDIVIAHEVGHAYGLIHTMTNGNLMNQGEINCHLALSSPQLAQIDKATQRLAQTLGGGELHGLSLSGRAPLLVRLLAKKLSAR